MDIMKREGFFGLYSGLNSSLLGIAITNGCVTAFLICIHVFTPRYICQAYIITFTRAPKGSS